MVINTVQRKTPYDIEDYIEYTYRGMEEYWIGLFKYLRPRVIDVKFHKESFFRDCERYGLQLSIGKKGEISFTINFDFLIIKEDEKKEDKAAERTTAKG